MPPKISIGINLSKPAKPTKPSPFENQNKPLAAGQKRKKTVFGDSDSESERVEPQANNNKNGAIEITTLGGLGDEEEGPKHENFTPRKAARMAPQLGDAKPPLKAKSVKSSIFDDENDEGQQPAPPGGKTYGLQKPAAAIGGPGSEPEYRNLAALHTSRKHAQQAEEIDPSIYSYDAVYDTIKAKREKKKPATTNDEEEQSSKYMESLMRTAEIRKRDQMRARDRLLAKEREAEGDEFADKEKFVTAAYRAQQEEVKRLEEEEAKREKEEEERRRKNGDSGMMGFYKQMLARDEESHGEVMKATEEVARKIAAGEVVESEEQQDAKEKSEAQIAAELNARGANIVVNDEGQIVDKRQLLSAGLNVAPKPKAKPSDASARAATAARPGARPGGPASREALASREAQRARQTAMIAAQLEEKARQEEEAEKARQKELAERNKSRKTETDVSSARERYLARKREREAAQNKG